MSSDLPLIVKDHTLKFYLLFQRLETLVTDWTNKYNDDMETSDTLLIQLRSEKDIIENKMKNLLVTVSVTVIIILHLPGSLNVSEDLISCGWSEWKGNLLLMYVILS